ARTFSAVAGASSLHVALQAPEVATQAYGDVPVLDTAAILSADGSKLSLFAVNRSADSPQDLSVKLNGWARVDAIGANVVAADGPERDGSLQPLGVSQDDNGVAKLRLPAFSWAVAEFAVA